MHLTFRRGRKNPNRYNERVCASRGHLTYRPTGEGAEQALAVLSSQVGDHSRWLCLRCENYVTSEPSLEGPVSQMPVVMRGEELHERRVMRLMALDRGIRTVLLALAAYALWLLHRDQATLQNLLAHYLPILNSDALGLHFNLESSAIESAVTHLVNLQHHAYVVGLAAVIGYAVVEAIEAIGLWTAKRWGEYWAFVATAAFLPLEVWELTKHLSYLKAGALVINIAIVVWLLYKKRLFKFRGGLPALRASYYVPSVTDGLLAPQPA